MIFIKGLLIGALMALPIGPSGAIAVRRVLTQGPRAGFLSGVGASVADVVYLAIFEYGAPWTLSFIEPGLIRGACAVVTVYIGTRLLVVNPRPDRTVRVEYHNRPAFLSSFLLSIANPTILISLAVLLKGFGIDEAKRDGHSPAILMTAVFCGSILLWLLLTTCLAHVKIVGVTRKITGVVFISVGVAILLASIIKLAGHP